MMQWTGHASASRPPQFTDMLRREVGMKRRRHALITAVAALAFAGTACNESSTPEKPPGYEAIENEQFKRQQALAEAQARLKAEKEKRQKELEAVGSATLTKKKLIKSKADPRFDMTIEFNNKSDKEIVSAEGMLEFYRGEKLLKQVKVPLRETIEAGGTLEKSGKFPYNESNPGDPALAKLPIKEVTLKWVPKSYTFADKTSLIAIQ
jgi:hypothetical protein